MATIANWQQDESAMSRIRVWQTGIEYLKTEPLTGGGFEGWRVLTFFKGGQIDWHSAYIEIATEHGLVGLGLWMVLLAGTVISLMRLVSWARRARLEWVADYGTLIQASLAGYGVGATTLGITYWTAPYHLIVASIILKYLAGKFGYDGVHVTRICIPDLGPQTTPSAAKAR
jgi:O-antigen ligase